MGGAAVDSDTDWTTFQRHSLVEPSPDLAAFVQHHWIVTWDRTGRPPYRQLIVPYPNVHLVFGFGAPYVQGVTRGRLFRELAGTGRVIGVSFRPGCFRPFLGSAVSAITNGTLPVRAVFGEPGPIEAIAEAGDETELVAVVEGFLRAHLPERDPVAEAVADMVARVAARSDITRVDDLARELDTSVRRLQRLFAEYVGVSPKWVIRRYRLHEVTERMAQGADIDWAGLAGELGYADQAHLTRDFTAVVGEPPTTYARRYTFLDSQARSCSPIQARTATGSV